MLKFSIVTITFNDAVGLASTIRSVGPQTFRNFEYIVQDGESTDGSEQIVMGFHNWVNQYFREPDDGIYDAMNKAVARCNGEFTLFLNSSDVFAGHDVLEQASNLIKPGDDIVHGWALDMESNERHDYRKLNDDHLGMTFDHQATFVRTDILRKLPFDTSLKIAGDLDFFCRCKNKGLGFRGVNLNIARKPFSVGASSDYFSRFRERHKVLTQNFSNSAKDIEVTLKKELLSYVNQKFGSDAMEKRMEDMNIEQLLFEIENLTSELAPIFELQQAIA